MSNSLLDKLRKWMPDVKHKHVSATYPGFTDKDEQFDVPETLNTVETLFPRSLFPFKWSITAALIWVLLLLNASLILFNVCPIWFHIGYFLFFRFCYNIGLGAILNYQSTRRSFTRFYEKLVEKSGGVGAKNWQAQLLRHLAATQLADPTIDVDKLPSAFRAWLVYKNLVNVILVNDGLNYLLLGLKCFHLPESWTIWVVVQYLIGLLLGGFNYWAKTDAHRAIGEYCWYWGDFFFRKEMTLTFDGIFELFPHPMYTVGYSLYYGYSMICRSYTMLFVSLFAHSLQLAFLSLVEEPHIERTYGSAEVINEAEHRALYDPRDGLFPAKRENVLFAHLDIFRSGDLALVLIATYTILLSSICPDRWLILQVVAWRCLHFIGGGVILWQQSTRDLWNRHFERRGRTKIEAFENWKRTYNLSLTMNAIVFTSMAVRYFDITFAELFSGWRMSMFVLGCCGVALSMWSFKSSYDVIGEFGWFYGDFFVAPSAYKQTLLYTGIYRFLNNPDCVTGYAGQYGAALITQSWVVFWLAALSHGLHIAFINLVEVPHMHRLYSTQERRGEGPLPKALNKLSTKVTSELTSHLPSPVKMVQSSAEVEITRVREEIKEAQTKAATEMFALYQKLDKVRGKRDWSQSECDVTLTLDEKSLEYTVGQPITVKFHTSEDHSETDWIGVHQSELMSSPGSTSGCWLYVPPGSDGEITFPAHMLPQKAGKYHIRYHYENRYMMAAKLEFSIKDKKQQ